jgi:Heparinase II/III-like protein/Heparinase II/III N-terminus
VLRRLVRVVLAIVTVGASNLAASCNESATDTNPFDPSQVDSSVRPATAPDVGVEQCMDSDFVRRPDDAQVAARLLAGRLTIRTFSTWTLPHDPRWSEDPFDNDNWIFNFHTLRWADPLRREGLRTGNRQMLDRYVELVRDWVEDNPYQASRSRYAWYDMAVGVRAVTLLCATTVVGDAPWLRTSMSKHAAVLMDPAEYRGRGNHALHQNKGLLALGCYTQKPAWANLAVARTRSLLTHAVDAQGVIDEGSVAYQYLNYRWYLEIRERMERCGLTPEGPFERIALMPSMLTHATNPDGTWVAYGDSNAVSHATAIGGTTAEYAATRGQSGHKPGGTFKVYQRGYAFSRTAWFDQQPAGQQSLAAMRFGPSLSEQVHGHQDAGAINYFALGKQLLWEPGQFGGGGGAPRRYVRSNEAHNVLDIPGLSYDSEASAPLSVARSTSSFDLVTIKSHALRGATWTRTMVHVKVANLLIVDDKVTQAAQRTVVQRWHLGRDRSVGIGAGRADTSGSGANLTLLWAGDPPSLSVAKGVKSPMLGWRSERANQFVATPVVQAARAGTTVRLTAVLVPRASRVDASTVRIVRTVSTSRSRRVDVRVGASTYRVIFNGGNASVRKLA